MKFITTVFLFILPFTLLAESSEWFIGLDAGARISTSTINNSYIATPEYGIKVGIIEKNSRIYLGYTVANDTASDVSKVQSPYLALEGISNEFKVVAKSTAKFFLGVRLGASVSEVNNLSTSAFLGGLQTGLVFMLPADFEIELAYRHYLIFNSNETNFDTGTIYTSLNYRFGAF